MQHAGTGFDICDRDNVSSGRVVSVNRCSDPTSHASKRGVDAHHAAAQDVYSGVADLVREQVRGDVEAGNPHAAFILPLVDRKLVKQTVMTSVYGVTFIGARQQVWSAGSPPLAGQGPVSMVACPQCG